MHVSWTSVERHLSGKKHHLNVLKREGSGVQATDRTDSARDQQFQTQVSELRSQIKKNGMKPTIQISKVKNPETKLSGIAVKASFQKESIADSARDDELVPYIRIISDLELAESKKSDSKYLVIAYEPFENVGIELPNIDIELNSYEATNPIAVDDLNRKCTYWDKDNGDFYIQLFFRHN